MVKKQRQYLEYQGSLRNCIVRQRIVNGNGEYIRDGRADKEIVDLRFERQMAYGMLKYQFSVDKLGAMITRKRTHRLLL